MIVGCVGQILESGWNAFVLRRRPIGKDDHKALATTDHLRGPSPSGIEIVGIAGSTGIHDVAPGKGRRQLRIVTSRLIERFGQRRPGGRACIVYLSHHRRDWGPDRGQDRSRLGIAVEFHEAESSPGSDVLQHPAGRRGDICLDRILVFRIRVRIGTCCPRPERGIVVKTKCPPHSCRAGFQIKIHGSSGPNCRRHTVSGIRI